MVLTKFQKLSSDSGKYKYYGFSAFIAISPRNDIFIYYKTESIKTNNHWITLVGDNDKGFYIGITLNETELKKFTEEDLKDGCTLYGAHGTLDGLTFKNLNIPTDTLNAHKTTAHKPAVHKTVRKPITRKVKRA